MVPRLGTKLALFITLIAAAAFAQSAEFGRASGGELDLFTKSSSRLSGSLGLSLGLHGYSGSAGGTLVRDKAWFFVSGFEQQNTRFVNATANANIGDRGNLAAMFRSEPVTLTAPLALPSSFLSLHYTGIVSANSFFEVRVSHGTFASGSQTIGIPLPAPQR